MTLSHSYTIPCESEKYDSTHFISFFVLIDKLRLRFQMRLIEDQPLDVWICSIRKGVLKNLAKFTGTHLCQSLFFNKVKG